MTEHKIPTTGRISSRMNEADVAKLLTRLQLYLPQPADWQQGDVEVELGMGNGLAMLERAKAAPHRLFVGCEVYLNGLAMALNQLQSSNTPTFQHSNIRLTNTDARELLASIPAQSISRILIPFPDPWPKTSHHKRRLVQPALLDECARVLKPGGELWIVSDWPSYVYHSIAVLQGRRDFILPGCGGAAADCKPSARLAEPLGPHLLAQAPVRWVPTKYQEKAATANRVPWFVGVIRSKVYRVT